MTKTWEPPEWTGVTCTLLAEIGDLPLLQRARQEGKAWDENTCSAAAREGHLEVLQWLRQNGCPWDAWTCTCAARNRHWTVLQWARQNGCPWDHRVVRITAAQGNLPMLQWLHLQDCPWDHNAWMIAAQEGHWPVVQWLLDQRPPNLITDSTYLLPACPTGRFYRALRGILTRGIPTHRSEYFKIRTCWATQSLWVDHVDDLLSQLPLSSDVLSLIQNYL